MGSGILPTSVLRDVPVDWIYPASGPSCRIGPAIGPRRRVGLADVILECEGPGECLETALHEAASGTRCSQIRIQNDEILVAAAYLATPRTWLRRAADGSCIGRSSNISMLPAQVFDPGFLSVLPSPVLAKHFVPTPFVLDVLPTPRCGGRPPVPRTARIHAEPCPNCKRLALRGQAYLNGWANSEHQRTKKYWQVVMKAQSNARKVATAALHANATSSIEGPFRFIARALTGVHGIQKNSFGVVVGSSHDVGFLVALARAAGADERTHHIYTVPYRQFAFIAGERALQTLRWATPHKADFVILSPGTLGRQGLDMETGRWNLHGDFELMDSVQQALRVGGRVYAMVEAGHQCVIIDGKGAGERIYNGPGLRALFQDWQTEEHYIASFFEGQGGRCLASPQVLVLRSQYERHPASLLSAPRLDIIPKLLYAIHYKGVGMPPAVSPRGKWAQKLYIRTTMDLNRAYEPCQSFAVTMSPGLEPCHDKVGMAEFEQSFHELLTSLHRTGFAGALSALHVSRPGGILINGAHRVAAAIALGLETVPVMLGTNNLQPSGQHLTWWLSSSEKDRPLGRLDLSALLMELTRRLTNPFAEFELHVIYVWPVSESAGAATVVRKILQDLKLGWVLDMQLVGVELRGSACSILIEQLHAKESWVKNRQSVEAMALRSCGHLGNETTQGQLILFSTQKGSKDKIMQALHSRALASQLYVSSNAENAAVAVAALMHPPTLAFVNTTLPSRPSFSKRVPASLALHEWLSPEAQDHCVISGDAVLQIHGLRGASAVEIICDGTVEVPQAPLFVNHGVPAWLELYGEAKEDLVHDPSGYFICDGWRFLTLERLLKFQRARHTQSDGQGRQSNNAPWGGEILRRLEAIQNLYSQIS